MKKTEIRYVRWWWKGHMWNFLTITISVSDGQIYNYKQLPSNAKIGDPTKTNRYCEVCQSYLPFSSLVWWYVILIVIIEI